MSVCEAFVEIVVLAELCGVQNLKALDGCWEHQVDAQWWIALNGHPHEVTCSHHGHRVPPFHIFVEFNDWPAGLIGSGGGTFMHGEGANEEAFLAALKAAQAACKS